MAKLCGEQSKRLQQHVLSAFTETHSSELCGDSNGHIGGVRSASGCCENAVCHVCPLLLLLVLLLLLLLLLLSVLLLLLLLLVLLLTLLEEDGYDMGMALQA